VNESVLRPSHNVFLVEQYAPGLTVATFLAGRPAASSRAATSIVSLFIVEDETVLSLFEAVDGAAVADANRAAGVTFTRVLPTIAVWGQPLAQRRTHPGMQRRTVR
jgi:hypothetical protein